MKYVTIAVLAILFTAHATRAEEGCPTRVKAGQTYKELNEVLECLEKKIEAVRQSRPVDVPAKGDSGSLKEKVRDAQSIARAEIDGVEITILSTRFVGDLLAIKLSIANKGTGDIKMNLFAGGSLGNGHSRMRPDDGKDYIPTKLTIGSNSQSEIVTADFIPGTADVPGEIVFKGIPSSIQSIDILDLGYSYNNMKPHGYFRFKRLSVAK
jgi:hypothetical protein